MNHKEILEIIKVFEKSALGVMDINQGEFHLYLKKMKSPSVSHQIAVQNTNSSLTNIENNDFVEDRHHVKSPMVGTFYRASSPDAEAFVQVGDTVKKGDVLCIVEAMKMLNEIQSDVDGIISEISVENGTMVDYGKTLFLIEKKDV